MNNLLIENKKRIEKITDIFLELLCPDNISCIICNNPIKSTNIHSLCMCCFTELHFILDGCVKCGKPIINNSLEEDEISSCRYCKNKSFYFNRAISCVEYNDFSKKIIFGLKYNRKTYMSRYVANIMKEKISLEGIQFDYILYVPLHKKRQRKRGFNQSAKISKYLGKALEKPTLDVLIRARNTKRLYRLNKDERRSELKGVFKLSDNTIDLKNKNVLLVDDIFTTGSTVNEISKVLKLEGVNNIIVMTFLTRSSDA